MKKKKPSGYYRRITESLPQILNPKGLGHKVDDLTPFLLRYLTVIMACLAVLLMVYLSFLYAKLLQVNEHKLQARDNLLYWESVVRKHPNFPDGYYKAGLYSYTLGNTSQAIQYLDRALALDPGFVNARELAKLIRE